MTATPTEKFAAAVFFLVVVSPSCRSSPVETPSNPAAAVSEKVDTAKDMAPDINPQKVCRSSDDCVLVNWGCCDDPCWGGLRFTTAVNRESEGKVFRITPCGQVCSVPMPCGYVISASCDDGTCTVHCSGECPAIVDGGSVVSATLGDSAVTSPVDSH